MGQVDPTCGAGVRLPPPAAGLSSQPSRASPSQSSRRPLPGLAGRVKFLPGAWGPLCWSHKWGLVTKCSFSPPVALGAWGLQWAGTVEDAGPFLRQEEER